MPTAGLPVASTTTSMLPTSAFVPSAVNVVVATRSTSQPTVRQASRARCGSRSTMTGISRPGVCGTCDRNIEPNLPAPISATRTGLPAARRTLSKWCRLHRAIQPSDLRSLVRNQSVPEDFCKKALARSDLMKALASHTSSTASDRRRRGCRCQQSSGPTAVWRMRASPGPRLPSLTSSQTRTSGHRSCEIGSHGSWRCSLIVVKKSALNGGYRVANLITAC